MYGQSFHDYQCFLGKGSQVVLDVCKGIYDSQMSLILNIMTFALCHDEAAMVLSGISQKQMVHTHTRTHVCVMCLFKELKNF